ncbi:MAG: DUF2179 domain-containing protein [Bacilli bacterium]|nr:DUF2179 domain-containing protein [Bacilli bacterium]
MNLFYLCIKIFLARILDVSIGTLRTMIMVKGKRNIASIMAFFEVLIWFLVAKEALNTNMKSIIIPISYSLGYASGTFIGAYLANRFIKDIICVQVITYDNKKMLKEIRDNDFGLSVIELMQEKKDKKYKIMLYIQLKKRKLKELEELIKKYDTTAFIVVNETKNIINGYVK